MSGWLVPRKSALVEVVEPVEGGDHAGSAADDAVRAGGARDCPACGGGLGVLAPQAAVGPARAAADRCLAGGVGAGFRTDLGVEGGRCAGTGGRRMIGG